MFPFHPLFREGSPPLSGEVGTMQSEQDSALVLPANTPAWTFQVWASFVIALMILSRGIWLIRLDPWIRGFMMIATMFTIASSFTLSKTLRDNRVNDFDTAAWKFFAWASFAVSMTATFTGIYWMPDNIEGGGWVKGFFLAAFFFQINASFSLSKTVRDNHEAQQRLKGY
jgi:hypothetical protein